MAPIELPVGIVTAMIGGPFFIWLLMRDHEIERTQASPSSAIVAPAGMQRRRAGRRHGVRQ